MNENHGEMPNPLNPNPADAPSPAQNLDANPSEPVEQIEVRKTVVTESVDPMARATAGITDQPIADPTARPMEQAPVAEPVQPKKKKTGLIVGIVLAAVLLIGGGIVAAVMMMNMNQDPVAAAVDKMMRGEMPQNAIVEGTLDLSTTDNESGLSSVKVELKSEGATSSGINTSSAKVTVGLTDNNKIEFNVDEVYAADGDLYLKVDGIAQSINDLVTKMQEAALYSSDDLTTPAVQDCDEEDAADCAIENNETDSQTLMVLSVLAQTFEKLDGQWLRVSMDELQQSLGSAGQGDNLSCLTTFVGDIKGSGNTLAELYKKNPFVNSTKEGVSLASKNFPVYKVTFDQEKLSGFSTGLKELDAVRKLASCMNVDAEDEVDEKIEELPTFFVEVDNDKNFSRIYFNSSEDNMNTTVDLNLTYPANINVAAPTDYKDFSSVMDEVFTSLFSNPTGVEGTIPADTL